MEKEVLPPLLKKCKTTIWPYDISQLCTTLSVQMLRRSKALCRLTDWQTFIFVNYSIILQWNFLLLLILVCQPWYQLQYQMNLRVCIMIQTLGKLEKLTPNRQPGILILFLFIYFYYCNVKFESSCKMAISVISFSARLILVFYYSS